jgi:hypothetical protein
MMTPEARTSLVGLLRALVANGAETPKARVVA